MGNDTFDFTAANCRKISGGPGKLHTAQCSVMKRLTAPPSHRFKRLKSVVCPKRHVLVIA